MDLGEMESDENEMKSQPKEEFAKNDLITINFAAKKMHICVFVYFTFDTRECHV